MNFIKFSKQIILAVTTILISVLFWSIFYFNIPGKIGFPNVSLETVYANYDGPNYLVISKCGYNFDCIRNNFSLPLPLEYYPAHLPGYPLLIKTISLIFSSPKAMLLATLIGSLFLTLITYQFLKIYIKEKSAFFLSLVFLIFPARFFVLRQVGAPETWFLATIIASIYFFKSKKYFISAIFAGLAQLIKSPGILLFGSYGIMAIYELYKTKNFANIFKKYFSYILVPLVALSIFAFYSYQTGDFLAYFHSGDNFHLNPLPFLVFISTKSWINTIWLEDIIFIYLISMYGVYRLFKKYKIDIISVFPAVFVLATLLVAHRDISRYIAPVYPFLLLAYNKSLTKKSVLIIMAILFPAILLFGINFVVGNTAPIDNWTPYL